MSHVWSNALITIVVTGGKYCMVHVPRYFSLEKIPLPGLGGLVKSIPGARVPGWRKSQAPSSESS